MDTRCARCNRIYYRRSNRQRFCTAECRFAAGVRTKTKPTAGLPAKRCERCAKLFVPTRAHQVFCKDACRHAVKAPEDSLRYDKTHRQLRRRLKPSVDAGLAVCVRCGLPIKPGEPWDLGHVDGGGPNDYSGPEHAACNRATAGRMSVSSKRPSSRAW